MKDTIVLALNQAIKENPMPSRLRHAVLPITIEQTIDIAKTVKDSVAALKIPATSQLNYTITQTEQQVEFSKQITKSLDNGQKSHQQIKEKKKCKVVLITLFWIE